MSTTETYDEWRARWRREDEYDHARNREIYDAALARAKLCERAASSKDAWLHAQHAVALLGRFAECEQVRLKNKEAYLKIEEQRAPLPPGVEVIS